VDKSDGEYFVKKAPEYLFRMLPDIKTLPDGFAVQLYGGIAVLEFQKIAQRIMLSHDYYAVCGVRERVVVADRIDIARHVINFVGKVEATAIDGISISRAIDTFKESRPDRPMSLQINHLAALAYSGDDSILSDYLRIFKQGYTMNFVPAVRLEHIRRAHDIAIERKYG